jgi:hypothetical protein
VHGLAHSSSAKLPDDLDYCKLWFAEVIERLLARKIHLLSFAHQVPLLVTPLKLAYYSLNWMPTEKVIFLEKRLCQPHFQAEKAEGGQT